MNSNPEEERGEQLIWLRDSAKAVAIQQSNPRGGYNYYCFPDEGTNLDNYPFRDIHNACETLIYFDELMVSVPPEDGPLVFIEPVKDLLVAEKSRQGVGTTDYAILLKFFVDKIADIPSSERRFRGRGAYGAFFLMTEKIFNY